MTALALRCTGVSKRFESTLALNRVDIELERGSWTALIGENGAGKSTLLNMLSGVLAPDDGEIRVFGTPAVFRNQREANRAGVFRWHQDTRFVAELSLFENIYLGYEAHFRRGGLLSRRRMRAAAAPWVNRALGGDRDLDLPVRALDHGDAQLMQLARIMACADLIDVAEPLLLMDEPTAALEDRQSRRLLDLLTECHGAGATVLYVTHRLREVVHRAGRAVVMRDGSVSGVLDGAELTERRMHALMVGREREDNYYLERRRRATHGEQVLGVEGVFALHTGEIIGLAGVEGSGRETVVDALFGLSRGGDLPVTVAGRPVPSPSVRRMLDLGVGLLPVDRTGESLVVDHSVLANLTLASTSSLTRRVFGRSTGFVDAKKARAAATTISETMRIKTAGLTVTVTALSGGNQQRVALGKWALAGIRVLVAVGPTQGVDVGTREQCYTFLRDFVDRGGAVLLVSGDLPELIGLSNRIVVMRDGSVVGALRCDGETEIQEEDVVRMMIR